MNGNERLKVKHKGNPKSPNQKKKNIIQGQLHATLTFILYISIYFSISKT